MPHRICYAVKANSTLAVLKLLADCRRGLRYRLRRGTLPRIESRRRARLTVVFSGVGKTAHEIEYALTAGIHSFNCESESELALLDEIAGRLGTIARFSLRINPDVDAGTHPYISTGLTEHKFGIAIERAEEVYARARSFPHLAAEGISCHIGSQMLDAAPHRRSRVQGARARSPSALPGHPLRHLDLGGGIGIAYRPDERRPIFTPFFRLCWRRSGTADSPFS